MIVQDRKESPPHSLPLLREIFVFHFSLKRECLEPGVFESSPLWVYQHSSSGFYNGLEQGRFLPFSSSQSSPWLFFCVYDFSPVRGSLSPPQSTSSTRRRPQQKVLRFSTVFFPCNGGVFICIPTFCFTHCSRTTFARPTHNLPPERKRCPSESNSHSWRGAFFPLHRATLPFLRALGP